MTLEEFAKLLVQTGKLELKVTVLSINSGNTKADKELPKTVIFSDKNGFEIKRVMINQ